MASKTDPVTEARRAIVTGFAAIILVGAILLSLPFASAGGQFTSFLDALFTSTSAVCVTGLVVKDTGTYFSFWGQLIILVLIHIGGLGYVTMMTLIYLSRGERVGLRQRISLAVQLNTPDLMGITHLLMFSLKVSLVFETIGAILLAIRFIPQFGPVRGLWSAIFHSISAFNNAGFDVMGGMKSLVDYASDPLVSITVMLLIIAGGLGFIVWQELGFMLKKVIAWIKKESKAPSKTDLSLHTRLVLKTTFWLILIPTIIIGAIEWNNPGTLGKLNLTGKILASIFQAVTPRTAGFSTIDIGSILTPTAILIAFLMFVGGSPGGTAGGIKTTTFVTVLAYLKSFMTSRKRVTLLNRAIPEDTVNLALSITLLQLGLASVSMFLLSITEHGKPFLAIFFETFSALGTVGLSRGITPSLTPLGKLIIILTMFAGRVGIISILAGYIFTPKKEYYSLPEDDIAVS